MEQDCGDGDIYIYNPYLPVVKVPVGTSEPTFEENCKKTFEVFRNGNSLPDRNGQMHNIGDEVRERIEYFGECDFGVLRKNLRMSFDSGESYFEVYQNSNGEIVVVPETLEMEPVIRAFEATRC